MKYLYIYLIIINIIAVIVTIHDKHAAVKGNWRVKERTLLLISALGGSPAMYLTMPNVYPFCLYVIEIKGTFNLICTL